LLERNDRASVSDLSRLASDPEAPAATVVHALRSLEGLDRPALGTLFSSALVHPAAAVREHGLQLLEPVIAVPGTTDGVLAGIAPTLALGRAHDEDARVRFQAAITLGAARPTVPDVEPRVAPALARIAALDGSDRWLRAAVFSALDGRETAFLAALRATAGQGVSLPPEVPAEFGRLLSASLPREQWADVLRQVFGPGPGFSPADRAALLTGFAESARGRIDTSKSADVLAALAGDDKTLADGFDTLIAAAARIAAIPAAPPDRRCAAVGLLGFARFDRTGEALSRLVDPSQPAAVQAAAVRALGAQRDGRVAPLLLSSERFAAYTPSLRDEVLSALLSQSAHVPGVLAAVEESRVPAGAIDALRRRQLTQSPDPEIKRRAARLFGEVAGDRAKVYEAYKDVITLRADPANGRAVFKRECASCHRLDQEGYAVGPDLFGIRNQPKEAILLHVLVPDHEITQGFTAYNVATKDGRVLTGLIASESPTSITLRQPLGKEDTILRDEIEELSAGKQSLMPQGLEKTVSRQEFADLLAYLKGEGPPAR
jgi:putative heme-binding domain-containing protein